MLSHDAVFFYVYTFPLFLSINQELHWQISLTKDNVADSGGNNL